MSDIEKQSLRRRVYLLMFLQFLVPGVILAIAGVAVSLFFTGLRAEYTRLVSFAGLLVMLVAGFLRVILVFMVNRWRSRKGLDDIY